ncbi:MAG: phytoene desaturase family protein [Candidatus Asgardarchaeia archaeon]
MFDVLIIGAGFTGLSAAALISEKHSVLVLDKNDFVGGRAATRTPRQWGWANVENYRVDFGHHVFATNNYLEFIIKRTKAERFVNIQLVKMPYFYRYNKFHKPPVGLLEQLRAYPFIPFRSKLKLNKFLKYVKKVSFKEVKEKWFYRPLRDLYDEFDFDEYGRELFTDGFAAGYQTLTDIERNSAGDLILCMKAFQKGVQKYKTPLFAAKGGVGKIAEAFQKVTEENGGKIQLNANVKEIIVENGIAKGVILADGKKIEAKKVLFTAPVYFLLDLIKEKEMPTDFKERLEKAKSGSTSLFLIMGGAKRPLLDKPVGTWILIPKTEVKNVNSYYLVYELDSSLEQTPKNRYYVSFAVIPPKDSLSNKDVLIKRMIDDLSNIFPNFDFEKDFEWRSAYYFPIVDGLERTIEWYYEKRFGPKTPIKNLFVAGDSAQEFSSGVDGCASSAIFAAEAITNEKIIDLESFYKIK